MRGFFNIFESFSSMFTTSSEELNNFLDGGFHNDRLYVITGLTGSFKTGFELNTMFQDPKKQVFMMGEMPDDIFETLENSYFDGFPPDKQHYEYMESFKELSPKDLSDALEEGADLVILDDECFLGFGKSYQQKLDSAISILSKLSRDFRIPIMYTIQMSRQLRLPDVLPSYKECGYEIIYVERTRQNGEDYLFLKRGSKQLILKFQTPYKVF
jgi:hypothetical protein